MSEDQRQLQACANTRRGLRGTAEEGFWTGGPIPLGFESRAVDLREKKGKKKLFIREGEAQAVRLIFDMASGQAAQPWVAVPSPTT